MTYSAILKQTFCIISKALDIFSFPSTKRLAAPIKNAIVMICNIFPSAKDLKGFVGIQFLINSKTVGAFASPIEVSPISTAGAPITVIMHIPKMTPATLIPVARAKALNDTEDIFFALPISNMAFAIDINATGMTTTLIKEINILPSSFNGYCNQLTSPNIEPANKAETTEIIISIDKFIFSHFQTRQQTEHLTLVQYLQVILLDFLAL